MNTVKLDEGTKCTLKAIADKLCRLEAGANGEALFAELMVIALNSVSKIDRIKGSADYERVLVYDGTGTQNVVTITHTGTTQIGLETIIETLTYVDPTINGSNVINIQYS